MKKHGVPAQSRNPMNLVGRGGTLQLRPLHSTDLWNYDETAQLPDSNNKCIRRGISQRANSISDL